MKTLVQFRFVHAEPQAPGWDMYINGMHVGWNHGPSLAYYFKIRWRECACESV